MTAHSEVEKMDSVETVELALLSADRTYQRSLKKHHKLIAKKFDPNAVGLLVVNRRPDRSLWVIDGQQRTEALKLLNYTHWQARVLSLATVEEEASLFGRLNGSEGTAAKVSQRDKYRAMVAAKDTLAMACIEAVKAGGMELVAHGHSRWPEIDCTGFVLGFTQVHGTELLKRGVGIIAASWPGAVEARTHAVVGAVMRLLSNHPEIDDDRAVNKFKQFPALQLQQKSREAGSGLVAAGVRFLLTQYNKGLKKNRIGEKETE